MPNPDRQNHPSEKRAPRRLKSLGVNLLIVICSLVFFGGLLEVGARLFWYKSAENQCTRPDPLLGYRRKPNCQSISKEPEGKAVRYKTNECGFRDHNPCGPKESGVFRIAAMGDSFTFGSMLPYDRTYLFRAESILQKKFPHKIEIIKTGHPAWGLYHYYHWLPRVLKLKPDLVLLALLPNDFLDEMSDRAWEARKKRLARAGIKQLNRELNRDLRPWYERMIGTLTRDSMFLSLMQHLLFKNESVYIASYLASRHQGGSYLSKAYGPAWEGRMSYFAAKLKEMRLMAEKQNAEMAVLLIPQRIQAILAAGKDVPEDVDPMAFSRKVSRICREQGIPCFDFLTVLSKKKNPGDLYFPVDGHLTVEGAGLLGDFLAKKLEAVYQTRALK